MRASLSTANPKTTILGSTKSEQARSLRSLSASICGRQPCFTAGCLGRPGTSSSSSTALKGITSIGALSTASGSLEGMLSWDFSRIRRTLTSFFHGSNTDEVKLSYYCKTNYKKKRKNNICDRAKYHSPMCSTLHHLSS